jgi:uncharacterized membrane protein
MAMPETRERTQRAPATSGQDGGQTRARKGRKRSTLRSGDEALAKGLGAFSIALGLAEVLAPRALSSLIGIRPRPILLRLLGLREIASPLAIFAQGRKPAGALWSRVAGDAIDLSLLGGALASSGTRRGRALFATANVCGVTALDVVGAVRFTKKTQRVVKTIAVNRPPDECYSFWRQLDGLPRFMDPLESVTVQDARRSHWVARGPGKMRVEWDAEIVRDEPGSLISWTSVPGSTVHTRGVVEFKPGPGGRGTIVHVALYYDPPMKSLGAVVARLTMTGPEHQLKESLRRFKQMIETGEIPTTEGQPSGERDVIHASLAKLFTGGVS